MRTVIAEAPGFNLIDNTGAAVAYRWTAAAGNSVGGYLAGLSTAQPTGRRRPMPRLSTTFPQALAGRGPSGAWVRAMSDDGVVLGPATILRTVITETPTLTLIDNSGAAVAFSWTAAAGGGAEGYLAEFATPPTNWTQTTNAATLTTTFPRALAGLGLCTGWVRGARADGVVLGPPTTARTLITEASPLTALDYDAGQLRVTWTPASGAAATDYAAVVAPSGRRRRATRSGPVARAPSRSPSWSARSIR